LEFKESEYDALLKLLDDDDSEVVHHVFDKIVEVGPVGIPVLQKILLTGSAQVQIKIQEVLEIFQFSKIYKELKEWSVQEHNELMKAVYLVSKVINPELDEFKLAQQIETIAQRIWLRIYQNQSPFEQIQVFNYVIFSEIGLENIETIEIIDYRLQLVDEILDSRKGNSLGIALLYLLVAENLELPIYGVNFPHHFVLVFTKYWHSQVSLNNQDDINDLIFYINLKTKGTTFSRMEIEEYLSYKKLKPHQHYFQPRSNKSIIYLLISLLVCEYEDDENGTVCRRLEKLAQIFQK